MQARTFAGFDPSAVMPAGAAPGTVTGADATPATGTAHGEGAAEPAAGTGPDVAASTRKRPLRVLVVDDSEPVRATVRQMVGLCGGGGFEVVGEAADGPEAVSMAIELKPDAVLMDINLPGCDGITAAARIREAVPTRIVMVSVENGREYFRRAMQIGAVDYLVKPFTPEGLADALRGVESANDPGGPPEVPASGADAPAKGRMIAVCGAKGGVGATTVALNLALELGRRLPSRGAAVCDLDPSGGLIGVMAGLASEARDAQAPVALAGGAATLLPRARLEGALRAYGAVVCDLGRGTSLSEDVVLSLVGQSETAEAPGVGDGGSEAPGGAGAYPASADAARWGGAAARAAAASAGVGPGATGPTSVPAAAGPSAVAPAAGDAAAPEPEEDEGGDAQLLLVVTGEVVALHAAAQVLKGPAARLPRERICLVVNRVGRFGAIRPEEVARTLDLPFWIGIPEEAAAIEAANLGRPLLHHRSRSAFSAAVERLAERLDAPAPESRPAAPASSRPRELPAGRPTPRPAT